MFIKKEDLESVFTIRILFYRGWHSTLRHSLSGRPLFQLSAWPQVSQVSELHNYSSIVQKSRLSRVGYLADT